MDPPTDAAGLAAAVSGMQDDPEMMAAFAEAQAELLKKKKTKKGKKKKKAKQMGEQLAQLEEMMAKLDDGDDLDLKSAQATLELLQEKPKKTKKIKKEKLPAPFSEEAMIEEDFDIENLPPHLLEELNNYEPTEEEIQAEFEKLKEAEMDKKTEKGKEEKES